MSACGGERLVVSGLEIAAHLGALPGEKDRPQRLTVTLELWPEGGFSGLDDRLDRALDYAAVCARLRELVAGMRPDLLETVAEAVAGCVLGEFRAERVAVEVRKYVPLGVEYVAARIERGRA